MKQRETDKVFQGHRKFKISFHQSAWEQEERKHHPSAGERAISPTLISEPMHPLLSSPALAQEEADLKSLQTYCKTN